MPSEVRIQTLREASGKSAEDLWEPYDLIFASANRVCPCRQSFWYDDFMKAMADRSFYKIIARINEEIVGIVICTFDLQKVSWINPEFYWQPREFHGKMFDFRGKVCYVVSIGVVEDKRKIQIGSRLMKVLKRILRSENGWAVAFDFSVNINPRLPSLIRIVTGGEAIGLLPEGVMDYQAQCLMVDPIILEPAPV